MVEQVIRDGTKRYVEAFNRGDAAAVAEFYTEDAKVLPNNMEMVSGKQAIQQLWKTAMEMGVKKMNLETAEVGYDGNLAYERGVSIVNIEPKGEQARTEKGKYLIVLKRQADGSWKVAVDIWNNDSPPQPTQ
jgi:uncharacterized protein (TIGR02246 family)